MVMLGLTGGTAAGKSTVAAIFADMGARVIDADLVARELQQPGSDALREIAQVFGESVVNEDGSLNRRALGRICFSERRELEKLNAVMLPRIKARIESMVAQLKAEASVLGCDPSEHRDLDCVDCRGVGECGPRVTAVVIDAAVLFEAGLDRLVDKVIAVVADPEVRVQRLVARTGLSMEEARERIAAQRSSSEFAGMADYVIDTSAGLEAYEGQVRDLYATIVRDHRS